MLTLFRRVQGIQTPPEPVDDRHWPAALDDTLIDERQQVLDEFCAYEREVFSHTPTPEELAEYERRKEQVRQHGRDYIRRSREQAGLPPLD
jgi:hypothetical protein